MSVKINRNKETDSKSLGKKGTWREETFGIYFARNFSKIYRVIIFLNAFVPTKLTRTLFAQ